MLCFTEHRNDGHISNHRASASEAGDVSVNLHNSTPVNSQAILATPPVTPIADAPAEACTDEENINQIASRKLSILVHSLIN